MAEVISETIIWVDADGNPTDDRDQAVRAEVTQELDDGTVQHTLADLDTPR